MNHRFEDLEVKEAVKYKLYLPAEEELQAEIETQKKHTMFRQNVVFFIAL